MTTPFRYYLRVRYQDCDQQQVVFNSRFSEYADLASLEFLRAALPRPSDGFDGTFEVIDWDTAITEIAAKLGEIRRAHSPRSIALVGIGGQGNHMDAPYAMAFLRGVGSRR